MEPGYLVIIPSCGCRSVSLPPSKRNLIFQTNSSRNKEPHSQELIITCAVLVGGEWGVTQWHLNVRLLGARRMSAYRLIDTRRRLYRPQCRLWTCVIHQWDCNFQRRRGCEGASTLVLDEGTYCVSCTPLLYHDGAQITKIVLNKCYVHVMRVVTAIWQSCLEEISIFMSEWIMQSILIVVWKFNLCQHAVL